MDIVLTRLSGSEFLTTASELDNSITDGGGGESGGSGTGGGGTDGVGDASGNGTTAGAGGDPALAKRLRTATTSGGGSIQRISSLEDPIYDGRGLQRRQEGELQQHGSRRSSASRIRRLMSSLCLSSKYNLKTQLMTSFGTVNLICFILVFVGCVIASLFVGENLKAINRSAFETELVPDIQATTVRYLAESLENQFMPIDAVDILIEVIQDRFQGYPQSLLNERRESATQQQDEQRYRFLVVDSGPIIRLTRVSALWKRADMIINLQAIYANAK